ncbi:hypothetical protein ACJJTC_015314 [Scirpophaga incertulas]
MTDSRTLAGDDSTATGLCPLTSDDDPALGTGTTRDIFHLSGKTADPTHRLNMCKSGSANTPLQSLIINVGIPSGPEDVLVVDFSRFRAALTSFSCSWPTCMLSFNIGISRVLTERAASRGSLGHLPQYACRARRPRSANFLIRGCLARQGRATVSIDAQFNLKSNRDRACV